MTPRERKDEDAMPTSLAIIVLPPSDLPQLSREH